MVLILKYLAILLEGASGLWVCIRTTSGARQKCRSLAPTLPPNRWTECVLVSTQALGICILSKQRGFWWGLGFWITKMRRENAQETLAQNWTEGRSPSAYPAAPLPKVAFFSRPPWLVSSINLCFTFPQRAQVLRVEACSTVGPSFTVLWRAFKTLELPASSSCLPPLIWMLHVCQHCLRGHSCQSPTCLK